ncbi:hypothetical protein ACJRO7_000824 [Eucalyptus globulus]|uniref:Uncharacterized protein n=1 Tax=Eucalyptus globulus TaxID=34317 RepID=A0ABD3LSI2_EUCGL
MASDVAFPSQCPITDEEAMRFFNDLIKDVRFDIDSSHLAELLEQVTGTTGTSGRCDGQSSASTSAAPGHSFILLALTFIQAFYARGLTELCNTASERDI